MFSCVEPLTEDYCGVEPVTHPPDIIETRPPPEVDEDKLRQIYQRTDSAILGGKIVSACYNLTQLISRLACLSPRESKCSKCRTIMFK